jgi:uncharacterized membrane protein
MRKNLFLLFFMLILADTVSAALIYGSVYDISLDRITGVRIEIDTTPKQTYISRDGDYEFNVPVGDYTLKAEYIKGGVVEAVAVEQISVKDEGRYVLDLVLFPELDEENQLIEESDEINPEEALNGNGNYAVYLWIAGLFIAGIVVYYLIKKKPKHKEKKVEKEEPKLESKSDLDKIVKILKQEGGRATQKEIRQHFPLSEAKMSLMITELEHKGVVKRIKKGRGNVIILEKS